MQAKKGAQPERREGTEMGRECNARSLMARGTQEKGC